MTAAGVQVHVHFAVAGAFPLRVADVCFTDAGVVVPEYALVTPLSGLAHRPPSRAATEAADRFRAEGLSGLEAMAERTHRIAYDDLEIVALFDGGRWGRPKVALHVARGPPHAYRIHAPVEMYALESALRSLGERRGFAVERTDGLGFSPTDAVVRFLADR